MHQAYSNRVDIRKATFNDLDDLTAIGIAAFPADPQWVYRYPYREQYSQDHLINCRRRYLEWINASHTSDCMILVAEVATKEDPSIRKPQAFSIWRMPSHACDEKDAHNSQCSFSRYYDHLLPQSLCHCHKADTKASLPSFCALQQVCLR